MQKNQEDRQWKEKEENRMDVCKNKTWSSFTSIITSYFFAFFFQHVDNDKGIDKYSFWICMLTRNLASLVVVPEVKSTSCRCQGVRCLTCAYYRCYVNNYFFLYSVFRSLPLTLYRKWFFLIKKGAFIQFHWKV